MKPQRREGKGGRAQLSMVKLMTMKSKFENFKGQSVIYVKRFRSEMKNIKKEKIKKKN